METKIQKTPDSITNQVLSRVKAFQQAGAIMLPPDYSPENALKTAELVLQDMKMKDGITPVLQGCTSESIANALLKMITEGLTLMKNQGAFIVYGNKMTWQREYFGTVALAKRFSGVQKVRHNVVYEGDVFKYSIDVNTGIKILVAHEQDPDNIDINKIKGAYAILIEEDGNPVLEYMTITQIKKSWMQGAAKGDSPAHRNFPDQMAMKTVINRICKPYINESDDSILFQNDNNNTGTFEDTTAEELKDLPAIPERLPANDPPSAPITTPPAQAEGNTPPPETEQGKDAVKKQKDLPF